MRKIILDFPGQFQTGLKAAQKVFLKPGALEYTPENIIICGMGGSSLPGEILTSVKPLDIFSHKSYGLPLQAGPKSLIICISYSGNTEETLSAFAAALSKNLPLIAIATGGKLEKLAQRNKVPLVKLPPPYLPPRLAIGQMVGALLQILNNHNFLNPGELEKFLELSLKLKPAELEKRGEKLAKLIFKKVPFVYTSEYLRELAVIWKNSLNETAKIVAIYNYFPELNHNEIVGFWKINEMQLSNKKLIVLILRDPHDHPRIIKQMKISKALIEKENVKVEFVNLKGNSFLEKIFFGIILGFWTSYHLALLYKIDPTQIKIIEEFKKRLAEK